MLRCFTKKGIKTHTESDITDLDHDAVKLQGRDLSSSAPEDGAVPMWNETANQYQPTIDCPKMIWIKATGKKEGYVNLKDNTNWAVSKSCIKLIRVMTLSTKWDLFLLQNDSGANDSTTTTITEVVDVPIDTADFPAMQIMQDGNGDKNIYLDKLYRDEDDTNEVHFLLVDNDGYNNFDIYIEGEQRR